MPGGGGKGGGSSEIKVINSGTTNVNATTDIVGLDDIKSRTELDVVNPIKSETSLAITEPIVTQSSMELAVTEPIVTQSSSQTHLALDVRPLVVDLCTKIEFGPLPETCIRQPYQRHFGITLFGLEVLGFNMEGEEQFIIQNLPSKPKVAWGGVEGHAPDRPPKSATHKQTGSGLHIRLAD